MSCIWSSGRGLIKSVLSSPGAASALECVLGCGGIVTYHGICQEDFLPWIHVSPTDLAEQLEFLDRRYRIIQLRELLARRAAGRSTNRCVAVTFDDAYRGIARYGLPVLERLNIPATVFVATECSRASRAFWWDRIGWAREHAGAEEWAAVAATLRLSSSEAMDRSLVHARVVTGLNGRVGPDCDRALQIVEQRIGAPPTSPLSLEEIAMLSRSGLLEFGCHTQTHSALPTLSAEEQEREIAGSYATLRDCVDRALPFVAYPFGLYDDVTVRAANAAGMKAGLSLEGRALGIGRGMYAVSRIGLTSENDVPGLRVRLLRASILPLAWRSGGFHPRLPIDPRAASTRRHNG